MLEVSPKLSFEFFPPRDEAGQQKLLDVADKLRVLAPDFMSVTFGAGGSTQDGTTAAVQALTERGFEVAPHLTCVGANRQDIDHLLDQYAQEDIKRIVALRGDLPSESTTAGQFEFANELVAHIRARMGERFSICVAAYPEMHPQALNPSQDLDNFVRKVQAGASVAITQYFFTAEAYFDFVDRAVAKGVTIPIIPGIMPITNYTQLARFSDMCGAEIPRWLRLRLAEFGEDKASIRAFGLEVITNLCQTLLDADVPGLHFYTMNAANAVLSICDQLEY